MNLKLLLILTLALLVRSVNISSYPPLNPDEAAIGYNAYSLLLTGKDEHGTSWPLHFKSFGDYKPGGYIYLSLPFIALNGLNPLSVRLPNIFLSLIALYYLYQIIQILTHNQRLSLITVSLASINPWLIHFNRGGWESSVALSLIVIGTFYFLKSLKQKISLNFFLFTLFFVLSLYVYHSARIIAPLLALSYVLLNARYLLSNFKKIIIPTLIAFLLCLPVLFSFLNSGGSVRFSGVGITADPGPLWRANELIGHHSPDSFYSKIIHSSKVHYLLSWADKYLSHFNPSFLFTTGDEVPRSKIPYFGQFYLIELLFLLFGLHLLFSAQKYRSLKTIIIPWLLVSPLASSLTFQAPSALRSLPLVIPILIIISLGFDFILSRTHKLLRLIPPLLYVLTFVFYLHSYFISYPRIYPTAWNYGFNQLVNTINSDFPQYDRVFVTNKYDQPYIYFLFFNQYLPDSLHPQITLTPPDQFGFQTVPSFDRYHFGAINWDTIPPDSLVITADETLPSNPVKTINFDNNQPAFKIYTK